MKNTIWVYIGVIVVLLLLVYFGVTFSGTGSAVSSGQCKKNPEVCDGKDNNCNKLVDENLPVACSSASQCGTSGWSGNPYCGTDGKVHKTWTNYACQFPGTCSAVCVSSNEDRIYASCTNGCSNGQCIATNSSNSTG